MAENNKFHSVVVAKIKGDDAGALADKIEKKAKAAFHGQIAALESKKVDAMMKRDDAKSAFNDALYPATLLTGEQYIGGIKSAQAYLEVTEEEVEAIEESISRYKDLLNTTF